MISPTDDPEDVMPDTADLWYLRFPDGRVLRAVGTSSVRKNVTSGRIPAGTRARRTPDEEWRPIERYQEFADLKGDGASPNGTTHRPPRDASAAPSIASRLDPTQLRHVGIPGFFEELLAALDSALTRRKLTADVAVGTVLGACAGAFGLVASPVVAESPAWVWALPAVAWLVFAWLSVFLAKMTFSELSHLKPARWREAFPGSIFASLRLMAAQLPLLLPVVGGIVACRTLGDGSVWFAVVATLVEAILWPMLLLLPYLAATMVVEQGGAFATTASWWGLVRRDGFRLFAASCLTTGMAAVVAVPAVALVAVLGTNAFGGGAEAAWLARCIVAGAALSPALGFVLTAAVFVKLRVAYDREG